MGQITNWNDQQIKGAEPEGDAGPI
jgi:hypothetical protein